MNSVSSKKIVRAFQALGLSLRSPTLLAHPLKETLKSVYREGTLAKNQISRCSIDELFELKQEIKLSDFGVREGNVSSFELMIIALIVVATQPQRLLEIGTFDGTTTLQIALNAPSEAQVHTLDLPQDLEKTYLPVAEADFKFIQDKKKLERKYLNTSVAHKVVQHLGDSTLYDFSQFAQQGPIDLCFIDGGHSYPCVKSDTEKTCSILSKHGIILWHDCDPNCPGVYRYLCELSVNHPIKHIEGTQLAILIK